MATLYLIGLCLLSIFVEAQINKGQLWISSENNIDVISSSGNRTIVVEGGRHVLGLSNPVTLATTDQHGVTVFLSELGNHGPSVYKVNQSHQSLVLSSKEIGESSAVYMESLAFDAISKTLYLTSRTAKKLYTFSLTDQQLKTKDHARDKSPTGITIDSCTRKLYWTNSDRQHPSVEILDIVTGESGVLVASNLSRPGAISYDQWDDKVYWSDSWRGVSTISRINTDGSDRELVYSGSGHDVFSLTVDSDWVYWSDRASYSVWRLNKQNPTTIQLVKSFSSSKPHGVLFIPESEPQCHSDETMSTTPPTDLPVSEELSVPVTDGDCANYCLHGDCYLDHDEPLCECEDGWSGDRCELGVCTNYCLHDATCVVVQSQSECLCPPGYHGDRCHLVLEDSVHETPHPTMDTVLVWSLTTVTGVLTIIVIILSIMVHKLRVRPKVVRKRFISVAGGRGDKGTGALPVQDGIQFDIENCCNMTLCETPCFDPPTRGPKSHKKKCGGAGDKKSLLADCDED